MSDYLPKEIIIEILLKLPVKSLIRFTVVCKSWRSIITNSEFIFSHLSNGASKEDNTLFLRRYMKDRAEHYTLLKDVENQTLGLQSSLELEFPFKSLIGYFRIVATAKGLVCLYDEFFASPTQSIILWNPCIRKHIVLPTPTIKSGTSDCVVLGFGATSCNIKVVRFVYSKTKDFTCKVPAEVEIYSLSSGTWQRVHFDDSYIIKEFMWSQAFIKDTVHWLAYDSVEDSRQSNGFYSFIASLHVDDEVFGKILLPDNLSRVCERYLSITVVGESLGVIKYDDSGSCVWVMKQYGVMKSWTKLYNIDFVGGIDNVVGFRKNGEVLLASPGDELVTYNPETALSKDIGIYGNARSFYIDKFMESLVLLTGQDVVADKQLLPAGSHTSRRQKHQRRSKTTRRAV
ncbi:F-box protein [Forsythia ovata]|uniref:F-box protein n=1 Tax=Forsythia ovata TaxID=205694 RepID=A0ABD1S884_9LAMI